MLSDDKLLPVEDEDSDVSQERQRVYDLHSQGQTSQTPSSIYSTMAATNDPENQTSPTVFHTKHSPSSQSSQSSTAQTMVTIRDLSKAYSVTGGRGIHVAVHRLCLNIPAGEVGPY